MSSSEQNCLDVHGLVKTFPGVVALNGVNLDLRRGEVHALCGENGAGKSTLIKVLSGVYPYGSYDGVITQDGREQQFRQISDSERAGIAVIHQELALVPDMTVAENVFLGAEITGRCGMIDWNAIYTHTSELLAKYDLQIDPATPIRELGVGQQQLVEIVKALSKESSILLLDEPTAALTESEVEILLGIIRTLKKRNVTCVYISHKLEEVFQISDRVTVLRDGESVATLNTTETNKDKVIRLMVGREIKDFFPRTRAQPGPVRLKMENVTVADKVTGKTMLENISLTVREGEVLGLGGLMGSGRTELLMHLFAGEGERLSGTVELNGKELERSNPAEAIQQGLVLVSEDRKRYGLILEQTIGFNLSLSAIDAFTSHALIDSNLECRKNQFLFDAMGVKAQGQDVQVGKLSGGNQQKVVLGKALMTGPKVILLDEPTRGIDVGAKVEVYEQINRLTAEGNAVIMVSSEQQELIAMSDRMIILSEGKVGGAFTRDNVSQEAILAAAMVHHLRRR